jgi:predicted nucleotidyltransferase
MSALLDLSAVPVASRMALEEILRRSDSGILAVILTGSAARGQATEHSDVDVMIVRDEPVGAREVIRSAAVDEIPLTLEELENVPAVGSADAWARWSFAWARVLKDQTAGQVRGGGAPSGHPD